MATYARDERRLLADVLEEAGPHAPTLCEGWQTGDLAAHLVLRERRPDAAGGIVIRQLAGWTEKVQRSFAERPYEELLRLLREGPPRLSLFSLPGADEAANVVEFFVHAEDVRRARPEWEPRELSPGMAERLWQRLPGVARFNGRTSPVGLVLRSPDGRTAVARGGAPVVTVTGEVGELMLFVFGRGARARVTAEGEPGAVARLAEVLPLP